MEELHIMKQFKVNVRYVFRPNQPHDIVQHLSKYYDIAGVLLETLTFVVSKVEGGYVYDQNNFPVVKEIDRPYFKSAKNADMSTLVDIAALPKCPRFEDVWYELKPESVSTFKFTREILVQLQIVENSVFRFKPQRITEDGTASIGGGVYISPSELHHFHRELDIKEGEVYKIRPSHIGVAWSQLSPRAKLLVYDGSLANIDRVVQCTRIQEVPEWDGALGLIDNGVAIMPIEAAKFMMTKV